MTTDKQILDDRKDLDIYMETRSPFVKENVEIVSVVDTDYPYMLHMSMDGGIKEFVPCVGTRQISNEDRTTAKVCVAPELFSAMRGYATVLHENISIGETKANKPWFKGGYVAYAIPYTHALKPNNKLVPDASMSNEHWLVAYNEDTNIYKPKGIVCKFFVNALFILPVADFKNKYEVEIFLEVIEGFPITPHEFLDKGHYYYKGPDVLGLRNYKFTKSLNFVSITKEEFLERKKVVAVMLSAPTSCVNEWARV